MVVDKLRFQEQVAQKIKTQVESELTKKTEASIEKLERDASNFFDSERKKIKEFVQIEITKKFEELQKKISEKIGKNEFVENEFLSTLKEFEKVFDHPYPEIKPKIQENQEINNKNEEEEKK